jgi:hypothetical protein
MMMPQQLAGGGMQTMAPSFPQQTYPQNSAYPQAQLNANFSNMKLQVNTLMLQGYHELSFLLRSLT